MVACDVSEEYTSLGKKYWEEANVAKKIELIIQPATQTLQELVDKGQSGTFDVAYIDADKQNYSNYVALSYQLVRTNGLIVIDNTLWSGDVINESKQDANTVAIRQLNLALKDDPRFDVALTTIADGVTFLRKK